jgi:hypothetical protein
VQFGWSPTSRMLAIYAHLTAQDAHNAILRENNLLPQQQRHDELTPIACRVCQQLNQRTAPYCLRCNTALTERAAYADAQRSEATQELFRRLCQVLVDKGLLNEAADAVHAAGLGTALQELATAQHPETR